MPTREGILSSLPGCIARAAAPASALFARPFVWSLLREARPAPAGRGRGAPKRARGFRGRVPPVADSWCVLPRAWRARAGLAQRAAAAFGPATARRGLAGAAFAPPRAAGGPRAAAAAAVGRGPRAGGAPAAAARPAGCAGRSDPRRAALAAAPPPTAPLAAACSADAPPAAPARAAAGSCGAAASSAPAGGGCGCTRVASFGAACGSASPASAKQCRPYIMPLRRATWRGSKQLWMLEQRSILRTMRVPAAKCRGLARAAPRLGARAAAAAPLHKAAHGDGPSWPMCVHARCLRLHASAFSWCSACGIPVASKPCAAC
jgi:hypothetical protein